MTIYVGGLRARLIRDSVYEVVRNGLTDLGWFVGDASHLPVTIISEPLDLDTEVPWNTVALSDENEEGTFEELGSHLTENRWQMYVDFFAENDAIGLHLIRDVKDLLEGRMASIGRTRPLVDVYDYTQATPTVIFTVEIQNAKTDKAHDFPHPWLRFWRSCSFDVVDYYTDESA